MNHKFWLTARHANMLFILLASSDTTVVPSLLTNRAGKTFKSVIMSSTEGEGDILFLVRILLASASASALV